jgi:hypothetical protein
MPSHDYARHGFTQQSTTSEKILKNHLSKTNTMRMLIRELLVLTSGVVIGVVLSYVAIFAFYGRPAGMADWGFPFVWKSYASASPGYLDYPARYEDIVFWLAVSVIVVEALSHAVWPRLKAAMIATP